MIKMNVTTKLDKKSAIWVAYTTYRNYTIIIKLIILKLIIRTILTA